MPPKAPRHSSTATPGRAGNGGRRRRPRQRSPPSIRASTRGSISGISTRSSRRMRGSSCPTRRCTGSSPPPGYPRRKGRGRPRRGTPTPRGRGGRASASSPGSTPASIPGSGSGLPKATLHGGIDDATGTVMGLRFDDEETLAGYYGMPGQILGEYGIPEAFSADRRTIFEYRRLSERDRTPTGTSTSSSPDAASSSGSRSSPRRSRRRREGSKGFGRPFSRGSSPSSRSGA